MIPWIILAVIIILAFFFFISGREKSQREIVVKHRSQKKRQHTDTEFAGESALLKNKISSKKKQQFNEGQPKITIIDNQRDTTADHLVHIGNKTSSISGHEMPLVMKLEPMFLALAKDPYWIFLTWILPASYPEGALEIKIKNLSHNTESFLAINSELDNWYIQLNLPNQRFKFELGVRDLRGLFQPLLYSNEIKTPADRPSDIIDTNWMVIDKFYQQKLVISPEGSPEFIIAQKIGGSEQFSK